MPFVQGQPRHPDAGRKAGTINKKTIEYMERIEREGITMLDIMVENARWAHSEAPKVLAAALMPGVEAEEAMSLIRKHFELREKAVHWAARAAEYLHPKLQAVAHRILGPDGNAVGPSITHIYQDASGNTVTASSTPAALENHSPSGSTVQ